MASLRARVTNGRLQLNEPTDLPEGSEVSLVIADDWSEMNEDQRAALESELEKSFAEEDAGQLIDADQVLRELGVVGENSVHAKGA